MKITEFFGMSREISGSGGEQDVRNPLRGALIFGEKSNRSLLLWILDDSGT
jgi:hypothetical protein